MGMYFLLNSELDTDMDKMEKEPGNINSMYTSKFNLLDHSTSVLVPVYVF